MGKSLVFSLVKYIGPNVLLYIYINIDIDVEADSGIKVCHSHPHGLVLNDDPPCFEVAECSFFRYALQFSLLT